MSSYVANGVLQIFDVDHGACALFTIPIQDRRHHVLIDCGHNGDFKGTPWFPGPQLRSQGISHVDLLLITNYDEDHMSGARSLREQGISVAQIVGNPTVSPEAIQHLKEENGMGTGTKVIVTSLRERLAVNAIQQIPMIPGLDIMCFYNPWPIWTEENNLSLVCHLSYRGTNFLFTGDMERRGMLNLLGVKGFRRLLPDVHVFVAPHHGRENGRCPELFDEYGCYPQVIIVSDCAKRHQSQETSAYYGSKARGIRGFRGQDRRTVLTTRNDGYIKFVFYNDGCYVE
jgi:beta-lactamase superfamily II metal-dependent hydrolase